MLNFLLLYYHDSAYIFLSFFVFVLQRRLLRTGKQLTTFWNSIYLEIFAVSGVIKYKTGFHFLLVYNFLTESQYFIHLKLMQGLRKNLLPPLLHSVQWLSWLNNRSYIAGFQCLIPTKHKKRTKRTKRTHQFVFSEAICSVMLLPSLQAETCINPDCGWATSWFS